MEVGGRSRPPLLTSRRLSSTMRTVPATIRIGTCSWADETLSKIWYPADVRSGAERLRYYGERFDTVEANSTFYRLPTPEMVERWAEATPPGFVMHVKAFGLMTRHPVSAKALPPDLGDVPTDDRGRVDRPSRELRAEVFRRFSDLLEPLRRAGKLGGILFQFPSYIVYRDRSLEYIRWAQEQLSGDELLIEFRHRSWLDDEHRAAVLAFLEERELTYVIVDAPRTEGRNLVPTVVALTTPTGYLRLHGRNAKTWNIRGGSAAERFDYLYSEDELREWVEPLRDLAERAENAYVLFNNNGRSQVPSSNGLGDETVAQAPTNAMMLRGILRDAGVPVAMA
jgi:uncharacterized protein YecE (DUF72 family)